MFSSGYNRNRDILDSLGLSFTTSQGSRPTINFGPTTRPEDDEEDNRNWWDRVFAPFEAPQQTAFALTTAIGEDGFQARDLWTALSHGAKYFNPFSNEERIDPDEVRQVFFGDQADGWVKDTTNLAIGVLFDPLFIAPIAKAAGLSGKALTAVEKIVNPAALAFDAAKVASTEVIGPATRTAFARVFGQEALNNADRLGAEFMVNVINRWHSIDEGVRRIVTGAENTKGSLYAEGTRVVNSINRLTPDARPLITEALEDRAIWETRNMIGPADIKAVTRANEFEEKVLKTGVSPDLFWQTYDRARKLDDNIGDLLLNKGLISTETHAEMRGTHLRRIYQAFEHPTIYAERLEALTGTAGEIKDKVTTNADIFRKRLSTLRDTIWKSEGPLNTNLPLFSDPQVASNIQRYFDPSGKLHANNVSEDILAYLNANSEQSISQIFEHVKNNMFGGMDLPPAFYEELGNFMNGTMQVQMGSAAWAKKLREGGMRTVMGTNSPTFTWRKYAEHLEVISKQKDLHPELRELLGEITDAAPRIASEVKEVGGLVAARQMFQELSGTKRISVDAFNDLKRAESSGFNTNEAMEIVQKVADDLGVHIDDLATDMTRILEEGPGAQVGAKGTAWASVERNDDLGHIYQMPLDDSYGDMAGMWTNAPTRALLRTTDARDTLRSQEGRLIGALGSIYRDGVGVFKYMKAVADPTGQTRNFMGGAILASMTGLGFNAIKTIPKAARELRQFIQHGNFGEYMYWANEAGVNIWAKDFANTELRSLAYRFLDDEVAGVTGAKQESILKPFSAMLRAFDEMVSRNPAVANAAKKLTGVPGATALDAVAHNFSYGDQFWKMNVFIDQFDKLRGAWVKQGKALTNDVMKGFASQAASLAEQSLFNYADVPFLVDFVRKWGIIPFATFPFKAAPFVAKTLYDAPWRVLRYDRLIDGVNNMTTGSPQELAQELDDLPSYMRERMVVKLPWNDGQNRAQFLDLSYYMPWQVISDLKQEAEFNNGFRGGLLSGPVFTLIDAIRNNKDSLGRPIVDTTSGRSVAQNFEAVANYITSFMLPSWVPAGARASSWGRTMQATATLDPSPIKWKDQVGLIVRSPIGAAVEALGLGESVVRENVMPANGQLPSSHTQATRGGLEGLVGNTVGSLLGGLTASIPGTKAREVKASRSQISREIASIRNDKSLSLQEKNRRVTKLMEELRQIR